MSKPDSNWQARAKHLAKDDELSWRKIAEIVGMPKSTVSDYLRKEHSVEDGHDNSRILFISDMHIPYHHAGTLEFLSDLKKRYEPTRVISLGDECFPGDVEVLTEQGFLRFDALPEGVKVAAWDEDKSITFEVPSRYLAKVATEGLLQWKHATYVSRTTPRHNLVRLNTRTGKAVRREAWDTDGTFSWEIPRAGTCDGPGVDLTDDQIRLLVSFQADGTFTKGAARWMFTKQRKIERLRKLLEACGVKYNSHNLEAGEQFYVEAANTPSFLAKTFDSYGLSEWTARQREVFVRELEFWDGTTTPGGMRYSSKFKENTEYVAAMLVTAGYVPGAVLPSGNGCWYVDTRWKREKTSIESAVPVEIPYTGVVYCVSVSTGMIITRTDGCVSVVGNCDKHSLSFHDSDPDLDSAGAELEKALPTIAKLHALFPKMDLIDSNHGSMVYRKAKHHGIPRRYIRSYNDVLGVGEGWKWHMDLTLELPDGQEVYVHHGKLSSAVRVSQAMGMSFVCGHFHEKFGVEYWANPRGLYWAMNTGCLIDDKSLAFAYNNTNLKRPIVGTGLLIDGTPILEVMPM